MILSCSEAVMAFAYSFFSSFYWSFWHTLLTVLNSEITQMEKAIVLVLEKSLVCFGKTTLSMSSHCGHRADSPVGACESYHCSPKTNQRTNHHCRESGRVEHSGEEVGWEVGNSRDILMMANSGAMWKRHIPVTTSHNPLTIFLYPIF